MSGTNDNDTLIAAFVAVAVVGFGMVIGLVKVTDRLGAASIPIWLGALAAAAWAIRGPLGQALADRLSRAGGAHPADPPQPVLDELDEVRARMAELEERVDFSERMLARPSQELRERP